MDQGTPKQFNGKKPTMVNTLRLVDIESEILKGQGVKPGLVLTEDPIIDLTELIHNPTLQPVNASNTQVLVLPASVGANNSFNVTNITSLPSVQETGKQEFAMPIICKYKTPANVVPTIPTNVISSRPNIASTVYYKPALSPVNNNNFKPTVPISLNSNGNTLLVSPTQDKQKTVPASISSDQHTQESTTSIAVNNNSPTPAEFSLSHLSQGFRLLNPTNLNTSVLNQNYLNTLSKNDNMKNTIISLPDNIYLIPASYFKGNNVVQIPRNIKVAHLTPKDTTKSTTPPEEIIKVLENLEPLPVENAIAAPAPPKEPELTHPCWSNKRRRKLDLQGFAVHDRLGFFKAEFARSKKCFRRLSIIIENEEKIVNTLMKQKTRKENVWLNRMEKQYNLKQCRVVLNKNDILNYFKKKGSIRRKISRKKPSTSHLIFTWSFETISFNALKCIDFSKPVLFINHHNFGTINFEEPEIETILFINTNNLITEMCLASFPQLRAAVQKKIIRIVNEVDLEVFLGMDSRQSISGHLPKKRKTIVSVEKTWKFQKFLATRINLTDKKSLQTYIENDHSYAIRTHEECNTTSLLKIKKSIPFC